MFIRVIGSSILALLFILPMIGVPWRFTPGWELFLATVVQFGFGYSFYTGSWSALKRGRADMDVLVALGTSAAYGYSAWSVFSGSGYLYFETSVVLIALILVGRFMESRSKMAAKSGMQALLKKQVQTARVKIDDNWKDVSINDVKPGDLLQVRPGESIPVDGEVVSGETSADESMMTGEAEPISKGVGSKVTAGTINGQGVVEIRTEGVGADTALGKMIKLVEEAAASKAPIQKLADRVSSIFVPSVIAIALITFLLWWLVGHNFKEGVMQSVAVLVVACPCALGLATPMVLVVVLAACAGRGILVKNAESLQMCSQLKTILFDKTGTITKGKLKIDKVVGDVELASSLAKYSTHPLSVAIAEHGESKAEMQNVESIAGKGVKGELEGEVFYMGSETYLRENQIMIDLPEDAGTVVCFGSTHRQGYFLFTDPVREEAVEVFGKLKEMGLKLVVLSGDRKGNVEKLSQVVKADEWHAEVLPDGKAGIVGQYQNKGEKVGMVGDGINDAPALTKADVGFAMGTGTDVAMESASIGLLGNSVHGVHDSITISRLALKKIKQNLFFAFFYNGIGIPIAALGLLNPMIAGAAMALSSVSVVLNALMLKRTMKKAM